MCFLSCCSSLYNWVQYRTLQGRTNPTLSVFLAHLTKHHYSTLRDENILFSSTASSLRKINCWGKCSSHWYVLATLMKATKSDGKVEDWKIDQFGCLMRVNWLVKLSKLDFFLVHTHFVTVKSLQGKRCFRNQIANGFSTGANKLGKLLDLLESSARHFKSKCQRHVFFSA